MHIREAKYSDIPHVAELAQLSIQSACESSYSFDQIKIWLDMFSEDIIEEIFEDENNLILVAVNQDNGGDDEADSDDEILSFGYLNLETAEIKGLYTHPDYTNQGCGATLLEFLETRATDNGILELFLDSSLNAVDFYKNFGYKEISSSEFVMPNGQSIPSVRMSKRL